jgi:hypothetical protein
MWDECKCVCVRVEMTCPGSWFDPRILQHNAISSVADEAMVIFREALELENDKLF